MDSLRKLISHAKNFCGEFVIIEPTTQHNLTYEQLWKLIQERGIYLQSQGIEEGVRVLVSLEVRLNVIIDYLALLYIGATPVSIKPSIADKQSYSAYVNSIKRQQGAVSIQEIEAGRSNIRQTAPSWEAFVQYTSGSTALPMPIALSDAAILHNLYAMISLDERTVDEWGLNVLPLCHDMGVMGGLLSNFVLGNSVILVDTMVFLRRPTKILSLAADNDVVVTGFPNYIMRYLTNVLARKASLKDYFSSYRSIYTGSEMIRRDVVEDFCATGIRFGLDPRSLLFSYGMAEATVAVSSHRVHTLDTAFVRGPNGTWLAKNGKPISGMCAKIAKATREEKVGEILIQGCSMFQNEQFALGGNEWYQTGDLGFLEDGELVVVGRSDNVLVIDGWNVHAEDVEQVLIQETNCQDVLAIFTGGKLEILIAEDKQNETSESEILGLLSRNFQTGHADILRIRPNKIVRTSSGKPIRSLTRQRAFPN